ncbi:MAG TPA: DUF6519 domain-containing protein [Actinomycetaceae bacterium]|nr:DUF6519 domain-containing protein [Actinomycetaceae bacterium]
MTGDFTSVPLRPEDRWTSARMQQGRVLLDTDWNLNIDAAARETRSVARDAIGFAGVPKGSDAFKVEYKSGALTVRPGVMWVDGLAVRNPADLAYTAQSQIPALPASGSALVYLDAFVEGVQAAEDAALLDPALDGVDTTTRTRVGWRVRVVPVGSAKCGSDALPAAIGTGRLDVTRTAGPVATDPCAPPDDPRSRLPDGLLRIEVIDGGTASTARFAWSFSDGADAVAAQVTGASVKLAPSPAVRFRPGDLVEVSTLARRADRRGHGALHTVAEVTPQAGGDLVTLATPSSVTGSPPGLCLRRWDGQCAGAAGGVTATLAGADAGISFTARPGTYLAGDWWGVRVRGSAVDSVEARTAAAPDGIVHAHAPLAVVDLAAKKVLADCRRTFPHLIDLRSGTCTVTAFPGEDLQAALDSLPDDGGKLCLAAGTYPVRAPLTIGGKRRVVIEGVGPASVLVADSSEAVLVAKSCDEIEVANLRVESSLPGKASPPGDPGLLGALTFYGGSRIRVRDCQVSCPDGDGRAQSGIHVAQLPGGDAPGRVEVRGNRLEIGALQTGVLIASAEASLVVDNEIVLGTLERATGKRTVGRAVAQQFATYVASHLNLDDEAESGGESVTLNDKRVVRIDGRNEIRQLAIDWSRWASADRLGRERTPRQALKRFAFAALTEGNVVKLSAASVKFVEESVEDARAIGQGIVVGGSRAAEVRIERNTVRHAIQGIHVGLRERGRDFRTAERVVISGNAVTSRVPYFWMRHRHAIYVGNFDHLTMADNRATLTRTGRTGRTVRATGVTAVDAVRVWGRLGPYLQIRGLELTGGFRYGVRLENTIDDGRRLLRYISDVLNLDGELAVNSDATVIEQRCEP